tara:strand:+ start:1186 stop:1794 length:609 start_codon:yes stop_codon:yes gene_type:complete
MNELILNQKVTESFIAAVKAVSTSASTDPARPILENLEIVLTPTDIKISATNSYMLTIVTMPHGCVLSNDFAETFMLKAKPLVKSMPTGKCLPMTICFNDLSVTFGTNDLTQLTSTLRKEAGNFPNVNSLTVGRDVPVSDAVNFAVNPKLMSVLAKQADVFRGKRDESKMNFKPAETTFKPIHMWTTVVDRGEWYGLLMPMR